LVKEIFLQALEQTGKMVIILDGFDEISPYYTPKVNIVIREIRDKTASKILVSSRFSYRQNLEHILKKLCFTLQPFRLENQIEFLEQYWSTENEKSKQGNLRKFAVKLLNSCSQNFGDKDGQFTCIPLQTMMLGEAFMEEAEEYCSKGDLNLPEKLNLLDLFNKFWEKKCDIYFREKNASDLTKPKEKREKESYLGRHMIAALISLFSLGDKNGLRGAIDDFDLEQTNRFLQSGTAEQFGIISHMIDGKPHFVHRCFAEYFAAKWFTDNFTKCEDFISDTLFNSTYEVTRNIFDRMLAQDYKLHGAVLNNDISAVEEFLKNGKIINISDKGGRTALHLAASYDSQVIQKLLSSPDVDVNIPDAVLKWTPLRYADRMKSWMAMDILLQKVVNPDDIVLSRPNSEAQEFEKEALWECASKGHRKLLEFMLNCGSEVNAVLEYPENLQGKNTLLHIASVSGQVEVTRLLVERKADINIRNVRNETALHLAAVSGNVKIIIDLLDKGMSVDMMNADDFTPLHVSAGLGHLEATKVLFEGGFAVNSTYVGGETPLHLAAVEGKIEVFLFFIEIGADINKRDVRNNTALHYAAVSGSVEIIKTLLDKGMSVNLTGRNGYTPLHFSAVYGNLEATKYFVKSGAAVNITNGGGRTPLHLAALEGKIEVFRYLTEIGADINMRDIRNNTALHCAAVSGSVEIIKILLGEGMLVDLTSTNGCTPLHVSAKFGNLEATKYFVERGAAVNITNADGRTPLHLAALEGKIEVFRYLTEIGADINMRDDRNNTALHCAAVSGSVEIIKILLGEGMLVDLTNTNGCTPLHVSAKFGNLEATKYFVEGWAAVNITNADGQTPLHLAEFQDKKEVVLYLSEIGPDTNT
jgi:ankyrin repeat protein